MIKKSRGAKKHTVSLRLEAEMYNLITELSELSETSRGALVYEFLEVAKPQMETMVKALRLAHEKDLSSYLIMSEAVTKAVSEAMETQHDLLEGLIKN